jgi:glycosyltransferase involved in cell wall biosynthesis
MPLQVLFDKLAPEDTSIGYRSRMAGALRSAGAGLTVAEGVASGSDPVLVFDAPQLVARARKRMVVLSREVRVWGEAVAGVSRRLAPLADGEATVTGFGVDLDHFRPVPPVSQYDQPQLLSIGPVTPRARLDQAIRATAALGEDPHCLWMHVGDAPTLPDFALLADWRDLVAQLDIQDRVEWRGPVPFGKLPAFHCAAKIVLDTTLEGAPPRELVEAMACGRPVLVSHPGLSAWLAERGFPELHHDGSAAAVAGGVRRLLAMGDAGLNALGERLRAVATAEHGLQRLVAAIQHEAQG